MARWIVFDETTADELRSQLPHQAVFEAPGRTALEYALTAPRTVVALLDAATYGEATVAVFRPGKHMGAVTPPAPATAREEKPMDSSPPPSPLIRASGFLGLSDHVVETGEDEIETAKRWWQFWK